MSPDRPQQWKPPHRGSLPRARAAPRNTWTAIRNARVLIQPGRRRRRGRSAQWRHSLPPIAQLRRTSRADLGTPCPYPSPAAAGEPGHSRLAPAAVAIIPRRWPARFVLDASVESHCRWGRCGGVYRAGARRRDLEARAGTQRETGAVPRCAGATGSRLRRAAGRAALVSGGRPPARAEQAAVISAMSNFDSRARPSFSCAPGGGRVQLSYEAMWTISFCSLGVST